MAEAPKDARHVPNSPEILTVAAYDFASEASGLPGFWIGRATGYFGGQVVKAEAKGRGSHRAVCLALMELANQGLSLFPAKMP